MSTLLNNDPDAMDNAFLGCTSLQRIECPDTITDKEGTFKLYHIHYDREGSELMGDVQITGYNIDIFDPQTKATRTLSSDFISRQEVILTGATDELVQLADPAKDLTQTIDATLNLLLPFTSKADGTLDATHKWLVVNAADPDYVQSNCFVTKSSREKGFMPLGASYIQLCGMLPPTEIFDVPAGCTWQDVTSFYEGLFFKATTTNFDDSNIYVQKEQLQNSTLCTV